MPLSTRMREVRYRGPGFDRIRLLAALAVVVHHCTTYLTPDIAHDYLFDLSRGVTNMGSLAVAVFFATSGALVVPGLLRGGDVGIFAINRFLRIMPALVATVLVTILLVGPLLTHLTLGDYLLAPGTWGYLNNAIFRAAHFLPGVTFPDGSGVIVNGSLWTLYFEVLSYVAIAVSFKLGLLSSKAACVALLAAVFVLNAACRLSPAVQGLVPERIDGFVSLFVYFMAGSAIYILADRIPYNLGSVLAAAAVLAVSLPLGFGSLTLPLLMPYLVVCLGFSGLLGKEPLRADYSYGIYLNHAVILVMLLVLLPTMRNFFIAVPVVALAAFGLAALSWAFIESPSLASKGAAHELYRKLKMRLRVRRPAN